MRRVPSPQDASRGVLFLYLFCIISSSWTAVLGARIKNIPFLGQNVEKDIKQQLWGWPSYIDEALADKVDSLPGWGEYIESNLFSGYITVDDKAGRALFYALAENPQPQNVPLLLWLNGGPGCSSIGGGFLSELGPLYPIPSWDGPTSSTPSSSSSSSPPSIVLERNPDSWHQFANVLFVESPAFVGFSYSNRSSDTRTNDSHTAYDLVTFLGKFLTRFPQYRNHPFYIAGESYAGHYVPSLVAALLEAQGLIEVVGEEVEHGNFRRFSNNEASGSRKPISYDKDGSGQVPRRHEVDDVNLQGFMIGNAWTDAATDNEGAIDFWWSHGLIGDATARGVKAYCNFSRIGPLSAGNSQCDNFVSRTVSEMGNINIYEIYADVCLADVVPTTSAAASRPRKHAAALMRALARGVEEAEGSRGGGEEKDKKARIEGEEVKNTMGAFGFAAAARVIKNPTSSSSTHDANRHRRRHAPLLNTVSSSSSSTSASLRRLYGASGGDTPGEGPGYDPCVDDQVESYLNRRDVQLALHANVSGLLPWRWTDCSDAVQYNWSDVMSSMLPTYHRILKYGKLRIQIYSGDVDGIVPLVGTRRWVAGFGLPVMNDWRQWASADGQAGGWVIDYAQTSDVGPNRKIVPKDGARMASQNRDGNEGEDAFSGLQDSDDSKRGSWPAISLVTVRGAGHMAPYVQPRRSYEMAEAFISGVGFPK
nr:serine carboxypeptidase 24 isoform a (SCPL24) [Polytomella parva]|mmetsp:Transcript_19692/g.35522  ORF Transcript_19692/g.35522 Transcript_19692/m.35522 type:complete len:706 (-) Transcript_19692:317-2434(-)|eukprot:CAMPEP_0175055730 /NCGR_PEP_ID=MMETSP0052_2-20121109/10252_1 /TAXON_ID=51329 ORGANISM="Polytomella parva, Strain SAG 63-3" /NCGR_SAMPLE_ID=MMETSP0052_2 /ASSEMBLY_ACC=CAM_ASM_000194 /LENGTH=705 /DNA_ID=CAMNT_0016320627 /DNA_START=127 /DNA_END=2244 /DNA_ORIENTATION=-